MLLLGSIRSIMRGCIANSIFRKPTRPSLPLKKVFRIPPSPFSQKEVFLKSSRPSLPLKEAPPFSPSLSSLRKRGCNRPTVLNFSTSPSLLQGELHFLPKPLSMVFTPPSVPPFPGDRNLRKRGCNRPPVLGTATL